jgi:alkylation response protein AidB-like acyl-CoA dehydrogenase
MKTIEQTEQRDRGSLPEPDVVAAIDTSKMSTEKRAALELTEAARDSSIGPGGVAGRLFMGEVDWSRILPFPEQSVEDRDQGDAFLQRLDKFLREEVDPDEIDRTGEIPPPVIEELARMGAFGIKVPRGLGGLGLSQTNYCRAATLLGSYCGNLTALISAHQSIGVSQPLLLFGTEEQKRKYLPRVAGGEISAFALTEAGVGSDPATMETRADPTPDGRHFLINGEKLWCTNGTKAGVIVVMAQTPPKIVRGQAKKQVTAFLVEMDSPGIEIKHRCRFMGLKALYNGVIRFTGVKVPRENILLAEGKGLRVALSTLNTGRLTLPAACVGLSKRCLEISRRWASKRVQWGAPIGRHAAIADKIARMAANTFVMEAMTLYTASLVDRDKHADIRLEAAMCKLWGTEMAWETVNDTMQIRGGRGYETAGSLRARNEEGVPVERFFRDSRINTIFEGSSEIMRLFIAREALDPHLKAAGAMFNSQLPFRARVAAAARAALFYGKWYPPLWIRLPTAHSPRAGSRLVRRQMRYAARTSRKLARSLFHAMVVYGPSLERQQLLLGRLVDIGTELFAIVAACARVEAALQARDGKPAELLPLLEFVCDSARIRIDRAFAGLHRNADRKGYRLARRVLDSEFDWMERGASGRV